MKLNQLIKIKEFVKKLNDFLYKEKKPILGRWCHVSIKN